MMLGSGFIQLFVHNLFTYLLCLSSTLPVSFALVNFLCFVPSYSRWSQQLELTWPQLESPGMNTASVLKALCLHISLGVGGKSCTLLRLAD